MSPDFSYLNAEALRTRQVLAAHFMRGCCHVLEIGGGENPISNHVHGVARVTVVDPVIRPLVAVRHLPEGGMLDVRHVAMRIEDYEPDEPADGLVMLGFEGEGHCDLDVVCRLIEQAAVTVIEASSNHAPAVRAIGRILLKEIHPVAVHLHTTYRGAGVPEGHAFCARNFYVLRRSP